MKATGDVCERTLWVIQRAKRSSRGRRMASGDSPRRQSRAPQWEKREESRLVL